jgi:hypothetical protein
MDEIPAAEPAPVKRRRWLWPLVGAVLVSLIAVLVVVIVVARGGADGPGEQFEKAAKTFHDEYEPTSKDLATKMAGAQGGFADPSFTAAQQDAKNLSDAFTAYSKAVKAIQFPEAAKAAAADVAKAADAGQFVMINSASVFGVDEMKGLLAQHQPQVENALATAERKLRAALPT